jgi:hypothetical protein
MQPKSIVMYTRDCSKHTLLCARNFSLPAMHTPSTPSLEERKFWGCFFESVEHRTIENYRHASLASLVRGHPVPKSEHGGLNMFNFFWCVTLNIVVNQCVQATTPPCSTSLEHWLAISATVPRVTAAVRYRKIQNKQWRELMHVLFSYKLIIV